MARGINEGDALRAGTEALGGIAAARQGTKPLQQEMVIGPDGLPIVLRDAQGNRSYQTTNDFDFLNQASGALDGVSDWRDASRVEHQTREAVDLAEQRLSQARILGDQAAIREAETQLREARQGMLRAELDRTLAQTTAAERVTGAVGSFQNSRAADDYQVAVERQVQRVDASLDGAKSLGRSLGTLAGHEALSEQARAQLDEQAAALAAGEAAILEALDRAEGDPKKIEEASEAFERLQEEIRTQGRSIVEGDQAKTAGGSSAARPGGSPAGAHTIAPPTSFGVATVRPGTTVWEISMRTGVPVDRILEFNAQGGNALDPDRLQPGQQIYVPLGAGDVQLRPRTVAEV